MGAAGPRALPCTWGLMGLADARIGHARPKGHNATAGRPSAAPRAGQHPLWPGASEDAVNAACRTDGPHAHRMCVFPVRFYNACLMVCILHSIAILFASYLCSIIIKFIACNMQRECHHLMNGCVFEISPSLRISMGSSSSLLSARLLHSGSRAVRTD